MLETIKKHLQSPNYLTAGHNYLGLKRELWPKISGDLYPLTSDYYHDLNPFFSFNAVNFDFFKSYPVVTLRDGGFTLGIFYTHHFLRLGKSDQVLLVHKDSEHFVPEQLYEKTLTYNMVQPKKISIEEAKEIYLVGILSDQMLSDLKALEEKVSILEKANPKAKIKIYLQIRKNPFEQVFSESFHAHPFLFDLYKRLKSKPQFITTPQIFSAGMLKDTYVINLSTDRYVLSDSFTDYTLAAKGATIHEWSTPSQDEPLMKIPVSLFHHMEINKVSGPSVFNDLVFIRKRATSADPFSDPYLFAKIRELYLQKRGGV